MKAIIILFLFIINYSLYLIAFPFKIHENYFEQFENPLNFDKIKVLDYLHHILNDFELISEINVGTPKQRVEVSFNFDSNYLTILGNSNSKHPYYYNLSSSYKEIINNDKNCPLKVENSMTIKELFHIKNEFHSNLNQFLSSDKETARCVSPGSGRGHCRQRAIPSAPRSPFPRRSSPALFPFSRP